jgi:hypothetical protein
VSVPKRRLASQLTVWFKALSDMSLCRHAKFFQVR